MGIKRYVDTNVFVYWLGGHPTFGERALRWVREIEGAPRGEYVTSSLTLFEVVPLVSSIARQNPREADVAFKIIEAMVSLGGLRFVPMVDSQALTATELMAKHRLDYEDALHLAVALEAGTEEIVSNDHDFDGTGPRRVF